MIDLNKVSEGIDYNIVPNTENDDRWAVEILRGDYQATGFIFDKIEFDGTTGQLKFKLTAIDLRSGSALNSDYQDLQLYAGAVLEDIIKNGIASGAVELHGQDSDQ